MIGATAFRVPASAPPADPRRAAAAGASVGAWPAWRDAPLVVGLGNPILGDDGVGWAVVEALRDVLAREAEGCAAPEGSTAAELALCSLGGLRLMERLVGYRAALVVDASAGSGVPVGTVRHAGLEELGDPAGGHLASPHDATLPAALALGRSLGAPLPAEVRVITVEIEPSLDVAEGLSAAVAAAVPVAVAAARSWLDARPAAGPSEEAPIGTR